MKRLVAWELVLLLAGFAGLWWALSALITLGWNLDASPGLQSLAAERRRQYRCFRIVLPGAFGFIAAFVGVTGGVLELLVSWERLKLHRQDPQTD
jgi:hypothetical protein